MFHRDIHGGQHSREQGWCSGESTHLPPLWPEFNSRTRRHMWVEFVVGFRPPSEGGRFNLLLCMSLSHQTGDFKSMLANYINLHSLFHLNEFVELLNNIYILAQNLFLAAFSEVTQFLVSARN